MGRSTSIPLGLVAAFVLTACGSSSNPSSSSTSTAGITSKLSIGTPTTTTPPSPQQELDRYLAAMYPLQQQYLHLQQAGLQAINEVNPNGPDASWAKAASELRQAQRQFDELAAKTANVTPPADLQSAHQKLSSSLAQFSSFYDAAATALENRSVSDFVAASHNPIVNPIPGERTAWRIAVIAAALRAHAHVPTWVRQVGTT